jgi:hypothetical protein
MFTPQRTGQQDLTHSEVAAKPSERPVAIRPVSSISLSGMVLWTTFSFVMK